MSPEEYSQVVNAAAFSKDYWLSLCPWMHIEDLDLIHGSEHMDFDAKDLRRWRLLLLKEGYFQLPPMAELLGTDNLRRAVVKLVEEGWMSPFGFMYDEFWLLFLRLGKLIATVMHEDFYRLPDFWIWHIDPKKEESGFVPHRDKGRIALFEDGRPKSVTMLISLSRATPLNGCMYLVPAHRDPTYNTENERKIGFAYQDIRALPAEPGTVFMWNQSVMHWGSHASHNATEPRVSVAVEFQRADVPPFNQPLSRVEDIPLLKSRVRLICKQTLQYTHLYTLSPKVKVVADQVMAEWGEAFAQKEAGEQAGQGG